MRGLQVLGVLGVLLALTASASAGPLVTGGLISYYSFDEYTTGGGSVADTSGNGYTGTVVQLSGQLASATGPTYLSRTFGNGLDFSANPVDGSTNVYVDLPHGDYGATGTIVGDGWSPTTAMTLAMWFKVPNVASGNIGHGIISARTKYRNSAYAGDTAFYIEPNAHRPNSEDRIKYQLRWAPTDSTLFPSGLVTSYTGRNPVGPYQNTDYFFTTGRVGPYTGSGGTSNQFLPGADDNWHQLSWTYDATASDLVHDFSTNNYGDFTLYGISKFYIDGVQIDECVGSNGASGIANFNTLAQSLACPIADWSQWLLLGTERDSNNAGWQRSFHGYLDEVYLFNRALSASEVQKLVPEPSTLMLLGTGLLGLAAYAWRRKRRIAK